MAKGKRYPTRKMVIIAHNLAKIARLDFDSHSLKDEKVIFLKSKKQVGLYDLESHILTLDSSKISHII